MFLNFSITELMVQFFGGGGGGSYPVHWNVFISIIGPCLLDANSTSSP